MVKRPGGGSGGRKELESMSDMEPWRVSDIERTIATTKEALATTKEAVAVLSAAPGADADAEAAAAGPDATLTPNHAGMGKLFHIGDMCIE
mmetsp:Transcript_17377/g.52196  ORF Transcript_17377/g.52196 Transcript_17377/m.52196 type:complete len:91 (+) Transcript_17377:369-641(+)